MLAEFYAEAYRLARDACLTTEKGSEEVAGGLYRLVGEDCRLELYSEEGDLESAAELQARSHDTWIDIEVSYGTSAYRPGQAMAVAMGAALARTGWELWPTLVPRGAVPARLETRRLPRAIARLVQRLYYGNSRLVASTIYAVAYGGALILPRSKTDLYDYGMEQYNMTIGRHVLLEAPVVWRRRPGECFSVDTGHGFRAMVCRLALLPGGPVHVLPLLVAGDMYLSVPWDFLARVVGWFYGLGDREAREAAGVIMAVRDIVF